jgi:shikimate kinase
MNIYFSGIIGTGKTTLAKTLGERWGWQFEDLDQAIERITGKTISQVVEDEGWLRYRSLEYGICKEFAQMHQAVIGLGGGTPRYEWNRDILKGSGIVILLEAEISILVQRVKHHDRPRVHNGTTLEQDLETIWEVYHDLYTNFAALIYRTDQGKSTEQEVDEIEQLLLRNFSINIK